MSVKTAKYNKAKTRLVSVDLYEQQCFESVFKCLHRCTDISDLNSVITVVESGGDEGVNKLSYYMDQLI